MKTNDILTYVMNFVNDLYDASEGSCMPELKPEELEQLNTFCKALTNESTTAKVLFTMFGCMTADDPAAPNGIADTLFEEVDELQLLSDQQQEKIYDDVFSLASNLVKEPGKYL